MNNKVSLETALEAADRLRSMCDNEEQTNNLLKQQIYQHETVLMENHIIIPDYELWHGEFSMV